MYSRLAVLWRCSSGIAKTVYVPQRHPVISPLTFYYTSFPDLLHHYSLLQLRTCSLPYPTCTLIHSSISSSCGCTLPHCLCLSSSSSSLTSTTNTLTAGMSVSSLRVLESPISHKDLFGVEHPLTKQLKRRKQRKRRDGQASGATCGKTVARSAGLTRHKKKVSTGKSKSCAVLGGRSSTACRPKVAETSSGSGPTARTGTASSVACLRHPHNSTSSSSSTLVQVELDSPQSSRKPTHSLPMCSSTAGRRESSIASQLAGRGGRVRVAWERGRSGGEGWRSGPQHVSTGTTVLKSATAIRTGSIITSLSKTNCTSTHYPSTLGKSSTSDYGHSTFPRWRRTGAAPLNPPPRLRVPRRTFATAYGRRGQGCGQLGVETIAHGLGCFQYRSVIVMSGAGISTPSGIPDFR